MEPEPDFYVLPPEHEAGAYATAAVVWYTAYDFTIDFAAPMGHELAEPDDVRRHRVVSRVRLPVGFAFELISMISGNMELYEQAWGEIHYPRRRDGGLE